MQTHKTYFRAMLAAEHTSTPEAPTAAAEALVQAEEAQH